MTNFMTKFVTKNLSQTVFELKIAFVIKQQKEPKTPILLVFQLFLFVLYKACF